MKTAKLNAALAKFQLELPPIVKTKTATIAGRDGKAGYSYTYADLADILPLVIPKLAEQGLSFTSMPTLDENNNFVLVYSLRHESGEVIEGTYPLPYGGSPQSIGSAMTYARRYVFTALVGIAADEDQDGAGTEPQQFSQQPPRPAGRDFVSEVASAWNDSSEEARRLLRDWWAAMDYPRIGWPAEALQSVDATTGPRVLVALDQLNHGVLPAILQPYEEPQNPAAEFIETSVPDGPDTDEPKQAPESDPPVMTSEEAQRREDEAALNAEQIMAKFETRYDEKPF